MNLFIETVILWCTYRPWPCLYPSSAEACSLRSCYGSLKAFLLGNADSKWTDSSFRRSLSFHSSTKHPSSRFCWAFSEKFNSEFLSCSFPSCKFLTAQSASGPPFAPSTWSFAARTQLPIGCQRSFKYKTESCSSWSYSVCCP